MPDGRAPKLIPTSMHWGTYYAEVENGRIKRLHDYEKDPTPSIIGHGIVDAIDDKVRVGRPMIRKGFLEKRAQSDRSGRGREPFVAVPWDEALDIASEEIARIKGAHGSSAFFAGSYGWGSSGRFHHAQSQIHRFFNTLGGYVGHLGSYSYAAAYALLPHIVGEFKTELLDRHTTWPVMAEHTELLVMFGGMPVKNAQVTSGGVGRHTLYEGLHACRDNGCEMVNISPLRTDVALDLDAEWLPVRPGSDAAFLLAIAHTLLSEGLHDTAFLDRYCTGFEKFADYVLGKTDGEAKTPEWSAPLTGRSADEVRKLARRMAASRTMISVAWGLQRNDHGEQPYWLAVTVAAMLGQIGLPGGGFGLGYGSENGIGNPVRFFKWAALPQGRNGVPQDIPVARISDLLNNPGGAYQYDGKDLTYPDIRLVYWAGGNPFHHHQDINAMLEAWRKPEVIISNDIWWTSLARHSDIVFPATTAMERNDLSMTHWEPLAITMKKAVEPIASSRNDYDIFSGLAKRLGVFDTFTEGRGEEEWLRHLWDQSRQRAAEAGFELPGFEDFWEQETFEIPPAEKEAILLADFRADPELNPLSTPSGKIEIFSKTIASFGYDDCPGHPVWREPYEWQLSDHAKTHPLHLMSNQPSARLHSQLDSGAISQGSKVAGREPITLHPDDAAARDIQNGDVVRVFNDRGACLAGAIISDEVVKGVARLPTGAWYDPEVPGEIGSMCVHGNPNVLTRDKGTSRLGQGPSAHTTMVEVERFEGTPPPVKIFTPPEIEEVG